MAGTGARRLAVAVAVVATVALGGSVAAQSVPEGQSCGGLLCDMGVFGHRTGPTTEAARPVPAPGSAQGPVQAAAPAPAEPATARRPKRIAKIVAPARIAAPARVAAPAKVLVPAAVPPVPSAPAPAVPSAAVPSTAVASTPAAASRPAAAVRAEPEIFVPLTPYSSPAAPARVQLQAITPGY